MPATVSPLFRALTVAYLLEYYVLVQTVAQLNTSLELRISTVYQNTFEQFLIPSKH